VIVKNKKEKERKDRCGSLGYMEVNSSSDGHLQSQKVNTAYISLE